MNLTSSLCRFDPFACKTYIVVRLVEKMPTQINMYSLRNSTQYTHLTNLLSFHTYSIFQPFFRSPFSISNPHKKASIPSNPAKSPPLTISLLFFPSLEPGSSVGPMLLVGVGPVLLTTVVPYTIISSLPLKTSPLPLFFILHSP
jgi:hypothetical protein